MGDKLEQRIITIVTAAGEYLHKLAGKFGTNHPALGTTVPTAAKTFETVQSAQEHIAATPGLAGAHVVTVEAPVEIAASQADPTKPELSQ